MRRISENNSERSRNLWERLKIPVTLGAIMTLVIILKFIEVLGYLAISKMINNLLWAVVIICFVLLLAYKVYDNRMKDKYFMWKYRLTENILPLDKEIYALGTAVPTKEDYSEATQKAMVKKTKSHNTLIVSNKEEDEIIESKKHLPRIILGIIVLTFVLLVSSLPLILLIMNGVAGEQTIAPLMLILIYIGGVGFLVYFLSKKLFYKGFKTAESKMKIESIPTSQVSSMSMGLVELKGKPKPVEETLEPPLTNKECIGYKYKIERLRTKSKGGNKWETKEKENNLPIFYLDDGTGKIPIDAWDIKIEGEELGKNTLRKATKDPEDLPEPAREYMEKYLDQGFFQWLKNILKSF